jgi:hypothetical protein
MPSFQILAWHRFVVAGYMLIHNRIKKSHRVYRGQNNDLAVIIEHKPFKKIEFQTIGGCNILKRRSWSVFSLSGT